MNGILAVLSVGAVLHLLGETVFADDYVDFLPIAFKLENQCSLQVFEDEFAGESLQWDRPQVEEYACDHRVRRLLRG